MFDFKQMLKRAHIQQLRSFFMDGVDLITWHQEEDRGSYEQRREKAERPIYDLLKQTFTDDNQLDEAVEKLNDALSENQSIFMEVGIRVGAILISELLRGNLSDGV